MKTMPLSLFLLLINAIFAGILLIAIYLRSAPRNNHFTDYLTEKIIEAFSKKTMPRLDRFLYALSAAVLFSFLVLLLYRL